MSEKLTLSLEEDIINFAHSYAQKTRKPISRIVSDYFNFLRHIYEEDIGLDKDLKALYGVFSKNPIPAKEKLPHSDHHVATPSERGISTW